jgi:hypothetical protein
MKHLVLAIVLALGIRTVHATPAAIVPVITLAAVHAPIAAVVASAAAADSGSAAAAPPSAQLHDPTIDPVAALGDVKALKARWPLLVLAIGIMLAKLVHFAGDKFGPVGKWLAVGHRAMFIAAAAALLSTLYDSLASGGTWSTALLTAMLAVAALIKPDAPKAPA